VDAAKLADHKWLYYRLGQLGLDRLSTEGRGGTQQGDCAGTIGGSADCRGGGKSTGIVKMETIQPMIAKSKGFSSWRFTTCTSCR